MLKDLLKLNLQFFSEEDNNTPPSDEMKNTVNEGVEDEKGIMIPKTRFDEVNNKFKDMQSQLNALLNEKQEAEQKQKEESGQFQELYESQKTEFDTVKQTVTQLETRNQELEAVVNTILEGKLKSVPEDFHDLIPQNLTTEGKLDWIVKAEEKGLFTSNQQPVGGITNTPSQTKVDSSKLSPMQMLTMGLNRK